MKNFFSQRVISSWNSLPQHVVDATSVNTFKNRLDAHWKAIGYGQQESPADAGIPARRKNDEENSSIPKL